MAVVFEEEKNRKKRGRDRYRWKLLGIGSTLELSKKTHHI
jgi:hypothetical protein